jgi:hypothetical protein
VIKKISLSSKLLLRLRLVSVEGGLGLGGVGLIDFEELTLSWEEFNVLFGSQGRWPASAQPARRVLEVKVPILDFWYA